MKPPAGASRLRHYEETGGKSQKPGYAGRFVHSESSRPKAVNRRRFTMHLAGRPNRANGREEAVFSFFPALSSVETQA